MEDLFGKFNARQNPGVFNKEFCFSFAAGGDGGQGGVVAVADILLKCIYNERVNYLFIQTAK